MDLVARMLEEPESFLFVQLQVAGMDGHLVIC